MSQYYIIVNTSKQEFIDPDDFGELSQFRAFAFGKMGAMAGLAVLLVDGAGRGGGDIFSDNPLVGSWAGDEIVIVGDYADSDLYYIATRKFKNISNAVLSILKSAPGWEEYE